MIFLFFLNSEEKLNFDFSFHLIDAEVLFMFHFFFFPLLSFILFGLATLFSSIATNVTSGGYHL